MNSLKSVRSINCLPRIRSSVTMSQFNYLPNSLPSATFKMRANPGGIYDRLAKSFTEMGPIALANAEINQDFFPHNFGESWSMNYSYRDCDSALFSANVFGEIVGQAHGTFVGAQGNHYAGKDPSNVSVMWRCVLCLISLGILAYGIG